ncbi:hypothetical protein [Mucilaginibacter psychrotolerans]|nr:hypothetical protein [Mucilaginibacter psychrotolerans]
MPLTKDGIPVTVKLEQNKPGNSISPQFEGLSYETQLLINSPNYLNVNNTSLIQMLKSLGPGILRIGGNTSDEIAWQGTERTPLTPANTLTTSDVDKLAAFADVTGWKVLFGLNLGNNDVGAAVDEAAYVAGRLKNNLYLLQFGNEPDVFHLYNHRSPVYNYDGFKADWEAYYNAVIMRLPGAPLAGPDVAYNGDWIRWFAQDESSHVKLFSGHHYNCGPASKADINYKTILAPNYIFPNFLQTLSASAAKYNIPFRISECNSVYGGGKPGVSNVFAASLWALDMMWQVAESNAEGVNFHGGNGLFYSPISTENGKVGPVYYAMLAFKYGSKNGVIIPTTLITTQEVNCKTYASANTDNSYSVTLINKGEKDILFTLALSRNASTAKEERLSAPAITSADGISFSNSTVSANGTFTPSSTENISISNKSFTVTVKGSSAAVVTIR